MAQLASRASVELHTQVGFTLKGGRFLVQYIYLLLLEPFQGDNRVT